MIRAEAAEWLLLRKESSHDAAREAAFQSWRLADPRHDRRYTEMAALWDTMPKWGELGALEPLERPNLRERWVAWRARRAERQAQEWSSGADFGSLGAAIAVLVILVVGPFLLPLFGGRPPAEEQVTAQVYETAPGEIDDIVLNDGSRVTLGAGSRISVAFAGERRDVRLLAGEAYFAVAHNTRRPFFVRAKGANVRVVGTEFSVSMGEATTRISIQSGVVDVSPVNLHGEHGNHRGHMRLTAGQGLMVWQDDSSRPPESLRVDRVAGWRSGRLSYRNAYLADILADISRYTSAQFDMAESGIGDMRVTASFRANEAAAAVKVILGGLDLTARETEDGMLRIRQAESE